MLSSHPAANGRLPPGLPAVQLNQVSVRFGSFTAVQGVDLSIGEGEFVAVVGPTGCGKSTLLNAVTGLLKPAGGTVNVFGEPLTGLNGSAGFMMQQDSLLPWKTALDNVALGLVFQGMPVDEARERARPWMKKVGLAGFEARYPHQLSGGQKKRISMAQTLILSPKIVLMDEPFSALDVLTAETLRTDFLELWSQGELPIGSVLLVTHNIEEAVQMCDRLLIFSTHPGRVVSEIPVDLPQPRGALDPAVRALVDRVYVEMTARPRVAPAGPRAEPVAVARIHVPLEHVSTNLLSGLIEALSAPPYEGRADLPAIAQALHMEADDLFPVAEALQTLHLAEVEGGDIRLTDAGVAFARSEIDERKNLFAHQLLAHVPLAAHVRHVLDERSTHAAPKSRFLDELEDFMTEQSAEQTLRALISWGRYAEIFAYDDQRQLFSLENPA